jgi:hypothetical protein
MDFRSIDKEGTNIGFWFSFFFQFCDIENLTNFSKNKMFNFYFGENPQLFFKKKTKFVPKFVKYHESKLIYCLLFTILRPFGSKESIRRKVDHGGQIVLWY